MANGDTKTNQYLDIAANGTRADLPSDTCCETRTQSLIRGVAERIMDVEDEVERLENNPDVVDIVATYANLQDYDTSTLTDKDVIRVLQDETHDGESTYYRYNKQSNTWTYIGESKQYDDFVGTDGTTAGEAGLVPAPATTDANKYLKSDGTWGTVQAGPTVVQTAGSSTTDVMSQNTTTNMVFGDNSARTKIRIGSNASTAGDRGIAIGSYASAGGKNSLAIGAGTDFGSYSCNSPSEGGIAIGYQAKQSGGPGGLVGKYDIAIGYLANTASSQGGAISLGAYSHATQKGQMDISTLATTNTYGYNNSQYRLLTGLYDPQDAHDAATKGYVDNAVSNVSTSLYMNYSSLYDPSEPGVILVNRQLFLDEAMTQPITCREFRDLLEAGTLLEIRAVEIIDYVTTYINLPITSAYFPTDEGFYDGDSTPFITMISFNWEMQKLLLHRISAEDYNASTFSCRTIEVSTT